MIAFLLGFILGFVGAIPVAGPVSALVLRYSLKHQYQKGRALALGAGLAEAFYVLLSFFGYQFLLNSVPALETASSVIASVILITLGIYFIGSKSLIPENSTPKAVQGQGKSAFIIGFGVSIVNPTLIATWTTVISTLHGLKLFRYSVLSSALFAIGVWAGISGWFTLMVALVKKSHHRFEPKWLNRAFVGIGVMLTLIGISTLISQCLKHFK